MGKMEERLKEIRSDFEKTEVSGGRSLDSWSILASEIKEFVTDGYSLGENQLLALRPNDDFAEEKVIFIGRTIFNSGHAELAFKLLFLALAHPLFRNKESVFALIDAMDDPAVQPAYFYVLECYLERKPYFSEKMAALALASLSFHKVTTADSLAVRFLDNEETETFSEAIRYLVSGNHKDRSVILANAVHLGGTREDIFYVLDALRNWGAKDAIPSLVEMSKLEWVNLERTKPIKAEVEKTIEYLEG